MKITAIAAFHFGQGNAAEIIQRGDSFTPPGTGQMNAKEHAQSLINSGCCCHVDDWEKRRAKTEQGQQWAASEVARMNSKRRV